MAVVIDELETEVAPEAARTGAPAGGTAPSRPTPVRPADVRAAAAHLARRAARLAAD